MHVVSPYLATSLTRVLYCTQTVAIDFSIVRPPDRVTRWDYICGGDGRTMKGGSPAITPIAATLQKLTGQG